MLSNAGHFTPKPSMLAGELLIPGGTRAEMESARAAGRKVGTESGVEQGGTENASALAGRGGREEEERTVTEQQNNFPYRIQARREEAKSSSRSLDHRFTFKEHI